jgi:RNA polymerase sigma-70 factor (ECF subfamily)
LALDIEGHYRRFGPMVLRRCQALLRNDGQAEDAMHDVFVAVLRSGDRLRDDAPAGLLLRDGEARAAARHLLGRLFGAADPLATSTATLAIMHLCDGLTLEETARESGLSVSGVRKRLARLRGRLAVLEGTAAEGVTHGDT